MSSRNLEHLFKPRSVALIGASDRPHTVGATVMRNLLRGGFDGPVWPVNLQHAVVAGREAYRTIESLPAAPDLAVICNIRSATTPPSGRRVLGNLTRRCLERTVQNLYAGALILRP